MVSENQVETLSCFPKQFPNMVAENKAMRCTLKSNVTTKGIWNVSEDIPKQFPNMVAENKTMRCILKSKVKVKVTTKGIWNVSEDKSVDGQRHRVSVGGSKHSEAKVSGKPSMLVNCGKRWPEMCLDGQRWKKQKMDLSEEGSDVQRDRFSVGGSKRPVANVSVKPSMPVKMSLDGQRWKKQKMDSNLKLECSKILKELMIHSTGWVFSQPVDPVKLKIPDYFQIIKNPMDLGTIKHKLQGNIYSDAKEFADDVKLTFENAKSYNPPSHQVHHCAEILDANFSRRWKLLEANNGQDTRPVLENNHQVMKPVGLTKAPMHDKFGTSRPISLKERRESRPGLVQVKPGKIALNGCSSLGKTAEKGHCNRSALRQSVDSIEAKCSSCVIGTCHCLRSVASQTSDSKLDCEGKCTSTSLANSSNDSQGPGAVLSEEKGSRVDAEMSPRKALRAAMLKIRFADTIFKATHPTLLHHGEKSDLSKMQQERQRREKEQLKGDYLLADLKMRRERERKALEKMKQSVEMDNHIIFGFPGYPDGTLARIGLRIKDDHLEESED